MINSRWQSLIWYSDSRTAGEILVPTFQTVAKKMKIFIGKSCIYRVGEERKLPNFAKVGFVP